MLVFRGYGYPFALARSASEAVRVTGAEPSIKLLGGRLSVDFINSTASHPEMSWERLIRFLEAAQIVTTERGAQLPVLPRSDPQATETLLLKAERLSSALRKAFAAQLRKQKV